MTDRDAICAIRAGSQDALAWVIDKYGAYVGTIVWNIIGNYMSVSDVEEVSSDVFFALWTQADDLQTTKLKSYLAAMARNKAKNKLREVGQELVLDDDVIVIDEICLDDAMAREEAKDIVRSAVNNMKEPEREILIRHYFYYQTMDTISIEMGINLSTVKTKLRRSKEMLRKILSTKLG